MQEVATVKSWININASPFAWQRILFKLLPEFKKEGFFFHTIKDDSKLSPTLLEKISEALLDTYKLELSRDFFRNSNQKINLASDTDLQNKSNQSQEEDLFKDNSTNLDDLI
ncbi:hypothetical protein V9L05_16710 [Bernardetia sp. Wsw4-3y2]|uniref:hypothetical protein n=1 Tax=unclassified Bernardetia TaxID=2647129 RepID=UPI0030D13523